MTLQETTNSIKTPGMEDLLNDVFGMSQKELQICITLMEIGEMNSEEIAEELDIDRSLATRYLNHLVDIGVVEKYSRLLSDGGRTNVYSHAPLADVETAFKQALCEWTRCIFELLDEGVVQPKAEALESARELQPKLQDGGHQPIYYDT